MPLPHTLTAEFTEAVDNLIQDPALLDSTLHSRAQHFLAVFDQTNPAGSIRGQHHVRASPAWAERILQKFPGRTPFTTPGLFDVMYEVADELGIIAGKRYVSAAICVCGEHVAPGQQAADLAQALHELSSTWAVFLIWPFYAHGHKRREREIYDPPPAPADETPTAESMAREQQRRWKQQVMARDDYHCFMSGSLDYSAYCAGRRVPAGGRVMFCYTVPIISPEVWAHDSGPEDCGSGPQPGDQSKRHIPSREITLGILTRFCGLDAATLAEKARSGPHNALFVHGAASDAFRKLMWCLHPTETPDRYLIKNHMSPVYSACAHVSPYVAFAADHDASGAGGEVDAPDRALLRTHAALAGVLHGSGAYDAFGCLAYGLREAERTVYLRSTGGAFWRGVVEYAGPEMCLWVGLWCDAKRKSEPERGGG